MNDPILAAARWLVNERQCSVIPLDSPIDSRETDPARVGKVPTIKWAPFQVALPSDDNITSWFSRGPRNLGILTGTQSRLVAVDGDSAPALDWMRAHLPPTDMRTRTARGEHWYYQHPGCPIPNKARIRVEGTTLAIDVRADGGYCVCPPSLHASGVHYERLGSWPPVTDLPLFNPAWLAQDRPPAAPVTNGAASGIEDRAQLLRRARAYVERVPPAVEGQGGDTATYQLACRLVLGFGLDDAEAFDLLSEWNRHCAPPWTAADLDAKISGARKYGHEPIGARASTPPPRRPARELSSGPSAAGGPPPGDAAASGADYVVRMNQLHAVVFDDGGRTSVVTEAHDPVFDRPLLTRSTFGDFRNFYLNEPVQVGVDRTGHPRTRPVGHAWLAHPDRRQYQRVVMAPGQDVPGCLNLWRGFSVTPRAGVYERYLDHARTVICRGVAPVFAWVWNWLANAVQHPERQAETALVLRGPRGTGKNKFVQPFGELFGPHYLHVANTRHLTGHFNAHLERVIVLLCDEALWAGDKAAESVLKMLITEPTIPIERKGRDVVEAKNHLHILMASNHDWVIPAGVDERRFCVLDVDPRRQGDREYFAALVHEIENGGREALLHALLHHDLSDFDPRTVPNTDGLREQKILTLQPNERWLFDKLMAGRWLPEDDGWVTDIPKDRLHADYVERLQRLGVDRRSTETELGMFIVRMFGADVQQIRRQFDGRPGQRGWRFPNLQACRGLFNLTTQSQHPWPNEDEDG